MKPEDFPKFLKQADGGCIEYTAGKSKGYGVVSIGGKTMKAHRYAWERVHGPIPDGLFVCHKCDNPPCCNPDHLFLGDNAANIRDAKAKARLKSGQPRLFTPAKIEAMWVLRNHGYGSRKIAAVFGVTKKAIELILRGETYQDVYAKLRRKGVVAEGAKEA